MLVKGCCGTSFILQRNVLHTQTQDKAQQKKLYYEKNKERLLNYQKEAQRQQRKEELKRTPESQSSSLEREQTKPKKDRSEYNKQLMQVLKEQFTKELASSDALKQKINNALNITDPCDWYHVTSTQLRGFPEGNKIRKFYKRAEFLKLLYPERTWVEGNFRRVSKGTWNIPSRTREFLDFLKTQLHVQKQSDWYRVSLDQIRSLGGYGMINAFGSLYESLKFAYPENFWDPEKFSVRSKKSSQKFLIAMLKQLFPDSHRVEENFLHPDLTWQGGQHVELDAWIEEQKIAFEYQGELHYHDFSKIFGAHGALLKYMARDAHKRDILEKHGITLVTVPYWWDFKESSLRDLITEANNAA